MKKNSKENLSEKERKSNYRQITQSITGGRVLIFDKFPSASGDEE